MGSLCAHAIKLIELYLKPSAYRYVTLRSVGARVKHARWLGPTTVLELIY